MLKIGGVLNIIIGIAHFIGLVWADEMFARTGVGEQMQRMATFNPSLPTIITIITGVIFVVFGLYGLSAAGVIRRLPLLKLGVFAIGVIYIARAVAGYATLAIASGASPSNRLLFSSIALIIGLLYWIGGLKKWSYIGHSRTK